MLAQEDPEPPRCVRVPACARAKAFRNDLGSSSQYINQFVLKYQGALILIAMFDDALMICYRRNPLLVG
jgi:hypothetical protein